MPSPPPSSAPGTRAGRGTSWVLGLALGVAACGPPPAPVAIERCLEPPPREGVAVARVGDAPILVEDVAEQIRKLGSASVRRYSEPKQMRQFVEDQVRFELLVQAAFERGLHNDPEVVEAARRVMVRKLLQHDMREGRFAAVDPARIKVYYEQHKDEYIQPEKRRFSEIRLTPTEEGRALARTLVERLLAAPDDPSLFRNLEVRHSLKKQVKVLGLSDLFQTRDEIEDEFGPSFANEIFSAEANAVIPRPVQSTRGWHVVKLHGVREALVRSLEEVEDEIRERLQRNHRSKAFEAYLTDLKRRHPVAIYDGRVTEVIAALQRIPDDPTPDAPATRDKTAGAER